MVINKKKKMSTVGKKNRNLSSFKSFEVKLNISSFRNLNKQQFISLFFCRGPSEIVLLCWPTVYLIHPCNHF